MVDVYGRPDDVVVDEVSAAVAVVVAGGMGGDAGVAMVDGGVNAMGLMAAAACCWVSFPFPFPFPFPVWDPEDEVSLFLEEDEDAALDDDFPLLSFFPFPFDFSFALPDPRDLAFDFFFPGGWSLATPHTALEGHGILEQMCFFLNLWQVEHRCCPRGCEKSLTIPSTLESENANTTPSSSAGAVPCSSFSDLLGRLAGPSSPIASIAVRITLYSSADTQWCSASCARAAYLSMSRMSQGEKARQNLRSTRTWIGSKTQRNFPTMHYFGLTEENQSHTRNRNLAS